MLFDFATLGPEARYKLLASTITPRPIAWVVSENPDGTPNAAPFSFFNAFSGEPPIVGIGIGSHGPERPKDTRLNIERRGAFVVNLVSEETAGAMNVTAIDFPAGVNELAEAGLTPLLSTKVKPPRIAESPVALECVLHQIVDLGPANALVLGRVVAMHVRDDAVLDAERQHIDTPALNLIGRLHGRGWYARTRDRFQIDRIPFADWQNRPMP